jgi:pSer/pThr/pTyr-binding forkhead associated (FHA) protein
MAGSPRVQLSLKGRLLSEVAFVGPQLRIGRMRENDVVVNNLAVSRFHAVLKREGDAYVLEDLGSENGTMLNGARVQGSVPMTPNDVIQLGKYELRLALQPGVQIAGAPKAKPSDAWDAAQTFLAERPAKAPIGPSPLAAKPAPAAPAPQAHAAEDSADDLALPTLEAIELEPETSPAAEAGPDPDGAFAFGEEDLAGGPGEAEAPPRAPAPNPEHTTLFDFGAHGPGARVADEAPELGAEADAPDAAAAPLHAGLIVQRDGKLHGIRPWEKDELVAGRAPECDVVLADAGVSRRHATFTRSGGRYLLRDLGSVNGVYVNGQRAKEHALGVGDVIRIESFELTFVLDHTPIGSEVSGPVVGPSPTLETARATQFSLDASSGGEEVDGDLQLEPIASDPSELATSPAAATRAEPEPDGGFEILPVGDDSVGAPPFEEEPNPAYDLPETDIVSDATYEEEEEKEPSVQVQARPAPAPAGGAVRLQLALDAGDLSPRAREALAILAEEGVALSARVSFERG